MTPIEVLLGNYFQFVGFRYKWHSPLDECIGKGDPHLPKYEWKEKEINSATINTLTTYYWQWCLGTRHIRSFIYSLIHRIFVCLCRDNVPLDNISINIYWLFFTRNITDREGASNMTLYVNCIFTDSASGPGQSSSHDVRAYVVCWMSPPREIYFVIIDKSV